jgi:uncharacterized protein
MTPEPPTQSRREAVREMPARTAVMRQRWAGLGFFHWRVEPGMIAARLPAGLYVDTWDGSAWLGVVPFFMRRVRPTGLLPLPWLSWFLELNVRTYVYDGAGRAGVWFFSLDCNQPLAVVLARQFFHLPYEHAEMRASCDSDGMIDYYCRRKPDADVAKCRYPAVGSAVTAPAAPGTLEWFLAERYLLFSSNKRGRIFTGQVHHAPYRLAPIDPVRFPGSSRPLAWNGFEIPDTPPVSALIAEAVDVKIYPLEGFR